MDVPALRFEIRLRPGGDLSLLQDVGDVTVRDAAGQTVVCGEVPDQAALVGLVARLRGCGFCIAEITRHLVRAG